MAVKNMVKSMAGAGAMPIYAPGATTGTYTTAQTKLLMPQSTTKTIPAHYKEVTLPGGGFAGGHQQRIQKFMPDRTVTEQESPESYLERLLLQARDAQNQSIATNEQRYGDILGGYRDRYGTAMDWMDQLGTSERAEIDRQAKARQGQMLTGAVARGLGNSSYTDSAKLGVDRERLRARGELEDRLLRDKLGAHAGLSGDTLSFMERRTDAPPDIAGMLQMAQNYGNYASPQSGPYIAGLQFAGTGPFQMPQFGMPGGGGGWGGGQQVQLPGMQRPGQPAPNMWAQQVQALQQKQGPLGQVQGPGRFLGRGF